MKTGKAMRKLLLGTRKEEVEVRGGRTISKPDSCSNLEEKKYSVNL